MCSFCSVFSVDGTRCLVTLSDRALSWTPYALAQRAGSLPTSNGCTRDAFQGTTVLAWEDACVLVPARPKGFALHCLCTNTTSTTSTTSSSSSSSSRRVYVRHDFSLMGSDSAGAAPAADPCEGPCSGWTREIRSRMARANGDLAARRPVLVVVNPYSGVKRAAQIWSSECAPLMDAAGARYCVLETAHAGHAYDTLRSADLAQYSAVVAVGGDGTVSEVFNGLMARADWAAACRTPLASVAAGTGNAICHTLYSSAAPACAVCHVIKGCTVCADAFLAAQPALRQYIWGVLNCSYGIVAEADFGSEKIRWAGSLRPSIWAVYRILCGTTYHCRLTFLPTHRPRAAWYGTRCTRHCAYCANTLAEAAEAQQQQDSDTAAEEDASGGDDDAEAEEPQCTGSQSASASEAQTETSLTQTSSTDCAESTTHPSDADSERSSDDDNREFDYHSFLDELSSCESGHSDTEANTATTETPTTSTETTTTTSAGESEEEEDKDTEDTQRAANSAPPYGPPLTSALTTTAQWRSDVPARFEALFGGYEHYVVGGKLPPHWTAHNNLSLSFAALQKMPWLMPSMCATPYSHMADGCMDVAYATSDAFSRIRFLHLFNTLADGSHAGHPKLTYLKVRAFTLEPLDGNGYLGVDGERIAYAPTQFHIAQGLVRFCCYQ